MKRHFRWLVIISLIFITQACLVTRARYDEKAKETDVVREGLAQCQKKTNALSEEIENLSIRIQVLKGKIKNNEKQLSLEAKETERYREMSEDLKKTYDASKISRETLINELLDKEKKYSSLIKDLSVKNTHLDEELKEVKDTLHNAERERDIAKKGLEASEKKLTGLKDQLKEKVGKLKNLDNNISGLKSKVETLEGKTVRLSEDVSEILPLSTARRVASGILSRNMSPGFIEKGVSILFATVPADLAMGKEGKGLAKEVSKFLEELGDVCSEGKGCSFDIIATGRTQTGEMEILVALKEMETSFLRALDSFIKSTEQNKLRIRRKGRITIIDKMGYRGQEMVEVRIYLVRS